LVKHHPFVCESITHLKTVHDSFQRAVKTIRMRRQRSVWICGLAALIVSAGASAHADSAADAEDLVREIYFEGLPYKRASSLDATAVRRLIEMLADPVETPHHGNVVLALGMSGHSDAFAALSEFANNPPTGEVDRNTLRARTHTLLAMGHLARVDARALRWLLQIESRAVRTPGWHFRHLRGEHLANVLEEQTLTGLALSGARGAVAPLDRAATAPEIDVQTKRRGRHARHLIKLHHRIASEGAAAVLSSPVGGDSAP
jgi:hypothetical protein